MLKILISHYGHAFAAFTLFVGQLSANLACDGPFYQPEVPKQLLKD
ncbi:MAG: cyclic lactone autoinducer peptide [Peptococcaceae bacterium]|nr:cyclic lactone autoinducer peptide [Peptococcaceae bacterium]